MEDKPDIFDRMMKLPFLSLWEGIYKKNKEVLLYLFFGGLTFLLSVASYCFFEASCGMDPLYANILSWILAVLFAYVTNRIWVFQSQASGFWELLGEVIRFLSGRLVTLVIEEVILLVFIKYLGFPSIVVKVIAQIVVIVLNYVFSKLLIFVGKKE